METYIPPVAPPERTPEGDQSEPKPRRRLFEISKKQAEHAPNAPEVKMPKLIERTPEQPALRPERRKFAATVMDLLKGEIVQAAAPAHEAEVASEGDVVIALDRVTAPSRTEIAPVPEEQAPEVPQFVERAKEVGRGVLRLIGRATKEVRSADRAERQALPTNLEPLAIADADIRAAMEELVAPIEAIAPPIATPEQAAPTIDVAVQSSGGGDREFAFLAEAKSPFARTLEVAASVESIAAREALAVKERVVQANEEQRLHELEGSNVRRMTQPERQQYVQDVSEFAHARATEIRTAARMREDLQPGSAGRGPVAADTSDLHGSSSKKSQQQVAKQTVQLPVRVRKHVRVWAPLLAIIAIIFILWSLQVL